MYFVKQMAELNNKPQAMVAEPDFPEIQIERKRGKKCKKEAEDKNVENYTHLRSRKRETKLRNSTETLVEMRFLTLVLRMERIVCGHMMAITYNEMLSKKGKENATKAS